MHCWLLAAMLAALLLNVLYVRIHLSSLAGDEAMAMAQQPPATGSLSAGMDTSRSIQRFCEAKRLAI
jgi:hypothetical protein